jgi:hypothetical protein
VISRLFRSQPGPSPLESCLFTFSRREEPFFVESPGVLRRRRPRDRYADPHELVGVVVDVHPRRTGRNLLVAFGAGPAALELAITSAAGGRDVAVRIAAGTD